MTRTKEIGYGTKEPGRTCDDNNCPFHGTLKVRGKQFTGKVVSDKMQRSVVVEWGGWRYMPKYERYKKTRTRLTVHNPPCINAAEGDLVKIGECRPLSKTKNFVILQVIGKLDKYQLEKEAKEEGKYGAPKKTADTAEAKPEKAKKPKAAKAETGGEE